MKKELLVMAILGCLSVNPVYASDVSESVVTTIGSSVDEDGSINGHELSNNLVNQGISSAINNATKDENAPEWLKRTDIQIQFKENWKPVYAIETIQPLNQKEYSVVFSQFRLANTSELGTTANIGFGYRKMNQDKTSLYGVNTFYDHAFKHDHARVGMGLEYFNGLSEFRANMYHGVSDEKKVDEKYNIFEKVVDGYDIELATSLKNAQWAKIYVQGYCWNYKYAADIKGYKVGTELQLTPRLSLDFGYDKNNSQSGEGYAKVMYTLGNKDMPSWRGEKQAPVEMMSAPTVEHKMLQKVRRENDIRVERYTKDEQGNIIPGEIRVSIKMR